MASKEQDQSLLLYLPTSDIINFNNTSREVWEKCATFEYPVEKKIYLLQEKVSSSSKQMTKVYNIN